MGKQGKLKTLRDVALQNKVSYLHQEMKTVQDTIPVKTFFPDGSFMLKNGNYSATWHFSDVNYNVAAADDKKSIFYGYGDLLEGLPEGVSSKLTIFNRKRDPRLFAALQVSGTGDEGTYTSEYNRYVSELMDSGNGIIQDKYITVNAAQKKSYTEAKSYFSQVENNLGAAFNRLGSFVARMDLNERLRILHDLYRFGSENSYRFNAEAAAKNGESVKDTIAPMSMCINRDYLEMGPLYVQAMELTDFGAFVSDDLISDLCLMEQPMMLSIDVIPIPLQEAVEEAQARYDAVETAVVRFREKHPSSPLPYQQETERKKAKEVLDDLLDNGQGMAAVSVTLIHLAVSKEQMDANCETLKGICAQHRCRLDILYHQQIDGLNTVLPYGPIHVPYNRLMTTDPASALMPFSSQEVCDRTGIPYGRQAISGNILVADRLMQINGNAFVLGVPGSGKSFVAKKEIVSLRLKYGDAVDILIIDPQDEYARLANGMGGAVINLASGSATYINALDMDSSYDDKNPLALKSEFLISLIEQMLGEEGLTAKARSVLDRCIAQTYKAYIKNGFQGKVPTLKDLSELLMEKGGDTGKEIAQSIELYTTGSLDVFARETNVDSQNPFTVYNIMDIGENLQNAAMFVVLDQIWNRLTRNFLAGRTTYIYIDEIYLMFLKRSTAEFFFKLWKQNRKYNGIVTGITQNVDECLASLTARTMLSNSDFLLIMRQSSTDADRLAELLKISEVQLSYIRNAEAGCGLMKVGSAIVPFKDSFPKDTELYRLISTNPRETRWNQEA